MYHKSGTDRRISCLLQIEFNCLYNNDIIHNNTCYNQDKHRINLGTDLVFRSEMNCNICVFILKSL